MRHLISLFLIVVPHKTEFCLDCLSSPYNELCCAASPFFSCLSPRCSAPSATDIADHVRGEMTFLASDALRGRGSATSDEFVAATYVASQFQSFGLEGAQVQRVPLASGGATYNAFAMLRGSVPNSRLRPSCSALTSITSARAATAAGEVIYHGADDDASGTTAVLELARALGALHQRPRRTILFVCFGSEETGGQGDEYFLSHPPLPLASIVANLEFEMIGQPDRTIRSRSALA